MEYELLYLESIYICDLFGGINEARFSFVLCAVLFCITKSKESLPYSRKIFISVMRESLKERFQL